SQRRLWILCQFEGRETSYHIPLIHAFDGQLDVAALRWALQQLVRRHEILRTVFRQDENDIVRQIVLSEKEAELAFSFSDVHKQAEAEELTSKGIQQLMDVPFDLETQPMLRAGVWRIAPQKYVFSLVVHHIICDNWSISILFKELLSLYKSTRSGNGVALPPLAIQYKDYAHWINQHLEGANMQRHENYWLEQFSGELPVLALPTDRPRPAIKTANGSVYIKYFAPKLLQQLKDTCRKKGATLYMGLMAALNALLFKYTAQTDIIIGSPIAGREHPDLETQIGFYANTIALRTRFDKHDSFSSLLATVKETTLNGFDHQMYPFDGLVDKLKLERDMSRDPLFDVMLSLQNVDLFDKDIAAELLDGVQISKANFGESVVSRYDLVFDFFEAEQSLGLGLEYNTDLFDRSSVERMVAHFEQLLSVLLERTEEELGSLDFIQGKERMQLLETFNDTERENEQHTVVDRIEEQAGQQPDKIVFTQGDRQLTFAALNSSANRLAHCLQKEHGIGPNKIVSIGLERSERLLISILAVLKTGGAYLPIDPAYPADRIEYICTHSDCELMMDEEFFQRYEDNSSSELSDDNLSVQISADQLAYVIYTSGSTGRPKGVMITHGNLTNFILGMNDALPLEEFEQFLALTSVAFDISILELLWTLSNGMSLVLPAAGEDVLHGLDRYAGEGTYHMDFSLFYFASSAKDKNQQYDLLLESVRYADEHHFKGVWLPERHFHEFGGIFPNPSVVAAGLATITKNVELRSGSCVLPLHDTIRVAEEWSVVDNLSNGRVALSIASGWHADDFVFRPERFENRHKQMYAQIEELHHLWQGGTVQRRNGKGQEIEIGIFPKPFQDKLPIYITAAGNVETFRTAGRMGARVLTHLLGQNIEDVKEKIQAYREALLTAGHRV
ncbi:MAG: MupA/Atu3671 family FMN-dependent luciferase-like monooxygenase, partial [Bacteroidota bacterium]